MKLIEEYFLGDTLYNNMVNIINWLGNAWKFLSGKKTYIGMGLLFVYGGLAYLGVELGWLKDVALVVGGTGLIHKGVKLYKD